MNKRLFWDVNTEKLNLEKDICFILERILNAGTYENFKEIIELYGYNKLKNKVVKSNNLSNKALNFASFFFSISKNQFKCYSKKLLNRELWNY